MLNDLCTSAGVLVGMDVRQLNTLSDYAVRTGYPGNAPTMEDAKEALEIARAVRKFARGFLGRK